MRIDPFAVHWARLVCFSLLLLLVTDTMTAQEVVVDFESVDIRLDPDDDEKINRLESYREKGVEFRLARQPEKSKARGRLMFFPHVSSGRKGILNAMSEEQEIPVQVRFPNDVSSVTISFWASTGSSALMEAFDREGNLVGSEKMDEVPRRKTPEETLPFFSLTIKAASIHYVQFSGPRTGEYLAADEVRFTPIDKIK